MDAELLRLIKLAESGGLTPRIQVMTSAALVVGRIGSAAQFWAKTRDPSIEDAGRGAKLWKTMTSDIGSSSKSAVKASMADQAALGPDWQESLRAFESEPAAVTPDALTVVDAGVFVANERLDLPVIRIPVSAVDGWWIVSGGVKSGGGGWMVGGIVTT